MTAPQNPEAAQPSQPVQPTAPKGAPSSLEELQKSQVDFTNTLNTLKSRLGEADEKLTSQRASSDAIIEKVSAEGRAKVSALREQVKNETEEVRAAERTKVEKVADERGKVASKYRDVMDAAVTNGIFTKAHLELLGFQAPRR